VRVLLDSCVAASVAVALVEAGHEVECVAAWTRDPGDEKVLATAHQAGQVVITLDKDFGELAVVRGHPHAGLVRLVGFRAADQAAAAVAVLARYQVELAAASIVTADPGRTRVRPPAA
jgi:predicted nuclease of predicted toxin-antitoxin system